MRFKFFFDLKPLPTFGKVKSSLRKKKKKKKNAGKHKPQNNAKVEKI